MTRFTRRTLLAGSAALPIFSIATRPAHAAEFTYKWANNLPVTHPMNTRGAEAMARIKDATGGRLEIQVFPNNQLGSDTDTLSRLRSGAVELHLGIDPDFRPARKAHPAFRVADLDRLAERLGAAGRTVRWDEPIGGRRRFFTDDPVGNRLEFIEA